MKLAESVTFGGAGFQRAAEFRTDKAQLAELLAKADARVLPVWRGKPLIEGKERIGLAYVSPGHPVLNEGHEGLIFLGIEGATPYFAMDVSAWNAPEPDTLPIGTFIDDSEQHHPDLPHGQSFAELRRNMARLSARDAELAAMAVGDSRGRSRLLAVGGALALALAEAGLTALLVIRPALAAW